MGMGSYSLGGRAKRSKAKGYATKSAREIFSQRSINNAMNPYGIRLRESRDSQEHPQSVAIILALDVTGSMGSIPHHLVKEGLPKIMGRIIQSGTKDPQLLFLAIGDHECDRSPLQVGQFESNDELLDKWLTDVYLEGGGGGNMGESYLLAWYFAGFHTSIDCFEKRKEKGFLFTIGDEPTLPDIPAGDLKNIMGDGQYETYTAAALLDRARESYHVFHLHIRQTHAGSLQPTMDGWKQLLGDHLIVLDRHEDVSKIIPEIMAKSTQNIVGADASEQGLSTPQIIL
ncbi:MAG: hypothetical protein D3923_01015 [Candidatus Electrothrix sp. AR3]|nr:hypothetical protein [Candidatus Electrothrix sp. AR3]